MRVDGQHNLSQLANTHTVASAGRAARPAHDADHDGIAATAAVRHSGYMNGLLEQLRSSPEVRADEVQRARANVARGAYHTQETAEATAEAILSLAGQDSKTQETDVF